MPSQRSPRQLDSQQEALGVDGGVIARCPPQERRSLGLTAGDAVLWEMEDIIISRHQRLANKGREGTHYGSEWVKKQSKATVKKLKRAGLVETNCIEFVLWAISRYYAGMAELSEPQPVSWGSPGTPSCSPQQLLKNGEKAIAYTRDSRGMGKRYATGGRGTALTAILREEGWKTVYFSPKSDRDDVEVTTSEMAGPLTPKGKKHFFVKGADSNKKVDVSVMIDKAIVGFSKGKPSPDIMLLSKIPFGIGFFNWGVHTFVVGRGSLYEVHWDKGPKNPDVFERSDFLTKVYEWESYGERYGAGSGVVAIPPESWPF